MAPPGMKGWIQFVLRSQGPADLPPPSPSLVTHPKNFNLRGLSVVVKYNTNGAGACLSPSHETVVRRN